MFKTCSYCNKEKSLSFFYKRILKDGTNAGSSRCKQCVKVYTDNIVKNNRERVRDNHKRYYYKGDNKLKSIARSSNYLKNKKDDSFYVYILPEEHYCGQTDNLYTRKADHKSKGRYVKDIDIVMKFKTRKEALQLESCFHNLGWIG